MSGAWEILPRTSLPASASVPPLLVKYKSGGAGYTIFLTDLTYIWSESLNNEQIVQRSLDEETSIEAKDDTHQLRVLLTKIGEGLRGGAKTNVTMLWGNEERHLRLEIVAHLPSPFRPLQWPVHLTPLAPEALKAELLIPLLANQKALEKQVASLLVHIKEKDNVILRLTDKLESSGIDMAMIFPAATGQKVGRGGLGKVTAAKVVPALAAFNERSWRQESSGAETSSGDENALILSLFPNELPEFKRMTDTHLMNAWWNALTPKPEKLTNAPDLLNNHDEVPAPINSQGSETGMVEESTEPDVDDEFERQVTPPSLPKQVRSQNPEALDGSRRGQSKPQDSRTESPNAPTTERHGATTLPCETVLGDKPPATSNSQWHDHPPQKPTSKPKKLGLVGGKAHLNVVDVQQADFSEASNRNDVQPSSLEAGVHVVEPSDLDEQAPQHSLHSTSAPVKVSHRLGVIGGKRKKAEGDVSDTHTRPATSLAFPNVPNEEKCKMEKLNATARLACPLDEEASERQERNRYISRTSSLPRSSQGIPPAPQTHLTPPPETSQERADRKRAELRRVLDEKTKAPIPKRRRF